MRKDILTGVKSFPFSLTDTDYERGINKSMKRFACGLFAVIGLLCVIFPAQITVGLPYVLGGAMVVAGILYGVSYLLNRQSSLDHSTELASGLVLLVIGIVCIIHGAESIGPMGTTWAIIGIRKASKSLSRTIQAVQAQTTFIAAFVEFLIRLVFSIMLLLYPTEKFEGHIILLGLDLIAASIRFTKHLSPTLDGEG